MGTDWRMMAWRVLCCFAVVSMPPCAQGALPRFANVHSDCGRPRHGVATHPPCALLYTQGPEPGHLPMPCGAACSSSWRRRAICRPVRQHRTTARRLVKPKYLCGSGLFQVLASAGKTVCPRQAYPISHAAYKPLGNVAPLARAATPHAPMPPRPTDIQAQANIDNCQ